jgi:general secretion pathway protein B
MSFILDALKKSENERQRQAGPALATVPASRREGSNRTWLLILVITMAVVIGILAVMLIRTDVPPPTVPEERPVVRSQPTPEPVIPATDYRPTQRTEESTSQPPVAAAPGQREIRSLRDEARSDSGGNAEDATPDNPGSTTPARPLPGTRSTTATRSETRPTDASQLPTARDLVLRGVLTGPPLHLDLHIYFEEPARRAIFVNGNKYREGDQIMNGPRVREILPEGAVLDDGRQLFLLEPD